MPYTVKLKNQSGEEVNYSSVEQVAVPLASGTGNAYFMARYAVTKAVSANITYYGGDYAANGVDYMCRISTGSTGKNVPESVTVKIGGAAVANDAYVYTKISSTEAVVKVNGSYITGDINIAAEAP
jgi:hypothetical protein